jgi:hypothetical protein
MTSIRGIVLWSVPALAGSIGLIAAVLRVLPEGITPMQQIALCSGLLSAVWSITAAVSRRVLAGHQSKQTGSSQFASLSEDLALLTAVPAAVVEIAILTIRLIHQALEMATGVPSYIAQRYGFQRAGLVAIGLLLISALVARVNTRDRRLPAALFILAAMAICWSWTSVPVFTRGADGMIQRTPMPLGLAASLSGALLVASALQTRAQAIAPHATMKPKAGESAHVLRDVGWVGFRPFCGMTAMLILVLVVYVLVVPIRLGESGYRLTMLLNGLSAGVAALAMYLVVRVQWDANLAGIAMGLTSLVLCSFAAAFIPSGTATHDQRYPMLFNAIIFALAGATGLCSYCAARVVGQRAQRTDTESTIAGTVNRFSINMAGLALFISTMMAVWPRLPGITTMDDSFGRMTAGTAANLFLLLVLLRCSRGPLRPVFSVLALLSALSAAGFVLIRVLPFAHKIH